MILPRLLTLNDLFFDQIHYEVPLYQRPYVWGREDQWEPLWQDICDTTRRSVVAKQAVTAHFLGSIVIELVSAEPGRVKVYTVIDGQQRLATLQVLLAAFRSVLANRAPDNMGDVTRLLSNEGRNATGLLRLKVLPGEHDRSAFEVTLDDTNGGLVPAATTGIFGAYHFFREKIGSFIDDESEPGDVAVRIETLQDVLEGLVQVVAIQLDGSSDAQVIFETLNSRGADLTSLDLAKNALLQQARRDGFDVSDLHAKYWQPTLGDADYWLELVRQGRYVRERADLFLMHWMTMRTAKQPRVARLFADFRRDVLRGDPEVSVRTLIVDLTSDAKTYRSFDTLDRQTAEGRFFERLETMDTTTLIPVALMLFRASELSPTSRTRALGALESWLVRRMILGATTQHYNRLLAAVLARLREQESLANADGVIIEVLRGFASPTDRWPPDSDLVARLLEQPLYGYINQRRIAMLLAACEHQMATTNRSEQIAVPGGLTIEHAMPQSWAKYWPLPLNADEDVARANRDAHIHRLGNLTVVTHALNSSLSDAAWPQKRAELAKRSQLLVNQRLCAMESWDESRIASRGAELVTYIAKTWPGPDDTIWS